MYMGFWDLETDKPKRISREVEKEYYDKFLERVPGFGDDSEWWKKSKRRITGRSTSSSNARSVRHRT